MLKNEEKIRIFKKLGVGKNSLTFVVRVVELRYVYKCKLFFRQDMCLHCSEFVEHPWFLFAIFPRQFTKNNWTIWQNITVVVKVLTPLPKTRMLADF